MICCALCEAGEPAGTTSACPQWWDYRPGKVMPAEEYAQKITRTVECQVPDAKKPRQRIVAPSVEELVATPQGELITADELRRRYLAGNAIREERIPLRRTR